MKREVSRSTYFGFRCSIFDLSHARRATIQQALALLLCISMILGSAQSVFAQDAAPSNDPARNIPPEVQQELEQKNQFEEAIQLMEEQLTVGQDDLLHLSVARGSDIGVSESIFDELKAGMVYVNGQMQAGQVDIEEVLLNSGEKAVSKRVAQAPLSAIYPFDQGYAFNAPGQNGLLHLDGARWSDISVSGNTYNQIRTGKLSIEEVLLSPGAKVLEQKVPRLSTRSFFDQISAFKTPGQDGPRSVHQQLESVVRDPGPCHGRTGIDWLWYGPRIYLNSCVTAAWVTVITAGGTAGAALCSLVIGGTIIGIPAGLACGVLIVLLAVFTAGSIQAINNLGGNHGIYIQLTWGVLLGQWQLGWMWHQ